ncbi:MAG: hypothetical protein MJ076_05070 [Clostridia bacterium]|nr:hypothetical protein [Clostridia bacterium]
MKNAILIGGDERTLEVYKTLKSLNYCVDTLGLTSNDNGDITKADICIFPVPTTKDGVTVFCPLTQKQIPLSIIEFAKPDAKIICGRYTFKERPSTDVCELDSYALLNAVPTAEGAIMKAIELTPFTLWKSKVLVIGYGRVGKVLCDRLAGLKCDVTVSARKTKDFAMLDALGIKHIKTSDVFSKSQNFDIIFNTIDVPLFTENLENLKNVFLIDLSSKGCIDFKLAENLKITAVKLPAIPGKIAPVTAGKILAITVLELISD